MPNLTELKTEQPELRKSKREAAIKANRLIIDCENRYRRKKINSNLYLNCEKLTETSSPNPSEFSGGTEYYTSFSESSLSEINPAEFVNVIMSGSDSDRKSSDVKEFDVNQPPSLHCNTEVGYKPFPEPSHPDKSPDAMDYINALKAWAEPETLKLSRRVGNVEHYSQWCIDKCKVQEDDIVALKKDADEQRKDVKDTREALDNLKRLVNDNNENVEKAKKDLKELISGVQCENTRMATSASAIVMEKVEKRVTRLEKRPSGLSGGCAGEKSLPLRYDAMTASKVQFTHAERHHPRSYITRFENYIADMGLSESAKCILFRSLITNPDAKEWVEFQEEEADYESLKESFMAEFWDPSCQRAALKYFREEYYQAGSKRTMAMGFLKWAKTMAEMENFTADMLIQIMYDKLPTDLKAQITDEEKSDAEKFIYKIQRFTKIREDPEANRVMVIGKKIEKTKDGQFVTNKDLMNMKDAWIKEFAQKNNQPWNKWSKNGASGIKKDLQFNKPPFRKPGEKRPEEKYQKDGEKQVPAGAANPAEEDEIHNSEYESSNDFFEVPEIQINGNSENQEN
ncbi:hypothetical protein U1Q18_047079 [Sarracenia purpurea var. burkii]